MNWTEEIINYNQISVRLAALGADATSVVIINRWNQNDVLLVVGLVP